MPVGGEVAEGNWRDAATASGSQIRAAAVAATSSLTPASSKFRRLRTSAIVPMEGMTASQAAASIGPCSQPASDSQVIPASASRSAPPGR